MLNLRLNLCFYMIIVVFFPIFLTLIPMGCASSMKQEGGDVKNIINKIDGETVVPRDANKIYINPFLSLKFPEISKKLVVNIKELLSIDGRLAIVDTREMADIELNGKIIEYQLQKIIFGKVGNAEKKRLRIVASIRLINLKKNQLILYENGIQAFKEFSEVLPPIQNEEYVKINVIKMLARRISSKTITGWYSKYLTPIEKKR